MIGLTLGEEIVRGKSAVKMADIARYWRVDALFIAPET
jgi:hypothetical protein